MVQLNIPQKPDTGSGDKVKRYFNTYYGYQLEFPSNDVDAVIGFLINNGFDKVHAQSSTLTTAANAEREQQQTRSAKVLL